MHVPFFLKEIIKHRTDCIAHTAGNQKDYAVFGKYRRGGLPRKNNAPAHNKIAHSGKGFKRLYVN